MLIDSDYIVVVQCAPVFSVCGDDRGLVTCQRDREHGSYYVRENRSWRPTAVPMRQGEGHTAGL